MPWQCPLSRWACCWPPPRQRIQVHWRPCGRDSTEAADELVIVHGAGVDAAGAEEIESTDPVRALELQHQHNRPRCESKVVGPHDLVCGIWGLDHHATLSGDQATALSEAPRDGSEARVM
jgi:hypothetical protein